MSGYTLHPEAYRDIGGLRLQRLRQPGRRRPGCYGDLRCIRSLVALPWQDYRRPNLTGAPLRFIVVYDYVLAYAPATTPLRVLAVIHGRRGPRVMAAIQMIALAGLEALYICHTRKLWPAVIVNRSTNATQILQRTL
jgi:hypothetical protein